MQIIITGKGVSLTDAIEDYVSKKINPLEKFFKGIIRVDVILGGDNKRHQKGNTFFAEGRLTVPGHDVFIRREATGLYEAVDDLKAHLERELKKYKVKLRGNLQARKRLGRAQKEYQA